MVSIAPPTARQAARPGSPLISSHSPLVARMEQRFLDDVSRGIRQCQFIHDHRRAEIRGLIDSDVAPRLIGNRLLHAELEHYLDNVSRFERHYFKQPGLLAPRPEDERIDLQYQEIDVGRWLDDCMDGASTDTAESEQHRFRAMLRAAPPGTDWIFRIQYPQSSMNNSEVYNSAQIMRAALNPFGLKLHEVDNDGNVTTYLPSLFLLELSLSVLVGSKSAKFSMASGDISRRLIYQLHTQGYRPIGISLTKELLEHHEVHPAVYALHDIGHGFDWSYQLSPWQRVAGAVLGESLEAVLDAPTQLEWDLTLESFLDLHFANIRAGKPVDLRHEAAQILGKLPERTVLQVTQLFASKTKETARFLEADEDRAQLDEFGHWLHQFQN